MTTARDLMIVSMTVDAARPIEPGDLSLALAGAELVDLLAAGAVTLDGERVVPGYRPVVDDRLLDQAASQLVGRPPYELVDDWLWRRGRDLSTAYLAAFEEDGQLVRERRSRLSLRAGRTALAESPARRLAADRWASGEPVLSALAAAVGIRAAGTGSPPRVPDDPDAIVLAVVNDAVRELEGVRQRRAIEQAAYDNIWRSPE